MPQRLLRDDHSIERLNTCRFQERRGRAFQIIHDNIKLHILWELEKKGFWLPVYDERRHVTNKDPKDLRDAIRRWNTEVDHDSKCKYLKGLSNMKLDQTSNLTEYQCRAVWLHRRLKEVNLAIPDDVQTSFVIEGLRAHYMLWAMNMSRRLWDGKLTFDDVIGEIGRLSPTTRN